MRSVSAIVADWHSLVRAGLRAMLTGIPGVRVIAEASDERELVRLVAERKPSLVVLTVGLPRFDGLRAARLLRQRDSSVKILATSLCSRRMVAREAMQATVNALVPAHSTMDELKTALDAVFRGETFIAPSIEKDIRPREGAGLWPQDSDLSLITSRQMEVLELLVEGQSVKQIAHGLSISVKAVEKHRSQIMARLGLENIVQLVRFAAQHGIIDLREPL